MLDELLRRHRLSDYRVSVHSIKGDSDGGEVRDFRGKAGDFRFHLKAANGEIIASGQGYKSKAAAEKGIDSVKANAPAAKVEDHTEQEHPHT